MIRVEQPASATQPATATQTAAATQPATSAQGPNQNQGQGASELLLGKSEQPPTVVDEDYDIGEEEDVSPEEIHELELQLKRLEDEELKYTAINLKQWSESEQLRQLNNLIKKEK